MILPSNNSLSEITRVFRLIQEAMNSKILTTTVIDNTKTTTVNKTVNTGTGNFLSAVTTDASLTGAGTAGSALAVTRSATAPVVNGTAAVGTSDASSRSDHVHPTDTSRAADSAVVHNTGNETGLSGNKTWTGIHTFSNAAASTSTSTGAVVVTGGVGIGGAVNCGALTATSGTFSLGVTLTGSTSVDGSVSLSPSAGLALRAKAGSVYDAALFNAGSTLYVWRVPAGTNEFQVLGSMSGVAATFTGAVSTGAVTSSGNAGTSHFNSRVGIGLAGVSARALLSLGGGTVIPGVSDTNQYGILVQAACSSAATSAYSAGYFQARTEAATFNSTLLNGVVIASPSLGTNSTASTIAGLRIENQSGGSVANYAIYTNTGTVRFGGVTLIADSTASTSTTTGALVVTGGVGVGNYVTAKYRSSDGTAGLTATRTFYTASSSGGTVNVLNTVTIKDGIITSWTQA